MATWAAYSPSAFADVDLRPRNIPLLVRLWYLLAGLALLGAGNHLAYLGGLRFGHAFYYFEFLLLPTLMVVLSRGVRTPPAIWMWLAWVLICGIHGALTGGFASMIYDRSRIFAVLLLVPVLQSYDVDSDQMARLLRPVFILAILGQILAVVWPLALDEDADYYLRDLVSFASMGSVYAVMQFSVLGRFRPWYVPMILVPLGYATYVAVRGAFMAILAGLAIPFLYDLAKLRLRVLVAIVAVVGMLALIVTYGPQHEAFRQKAFSSGGFEAESITHTFTARVNEFGAIYEEMSIPQYFYGKGMGQVWNGSDLYGAKERDRYTFHIYYFEIFWQMGLIGIALFAAVFVVPTIKALLHFRKLDVMGRVGVVSMVILLISFGNSASATWTEACYYATALYCMSAGRRRPELANWSEAAPGEVLPMNPSAAF